MKWLTLVLVGVLVALQYRLWVGEGSIAHVVRLDNAIKKQTVENTQLKLKNQILAAEVDALKNNDDAVEARARSEMGMIKEGETYFMIVDE